MKTALVTGAAGFIGSHLVRQLTEKGVQVRAAVMPRESTRNIDALKPEVVRGDILDKSFAASIVDGVDTVFHLAAVYATWMPDWRPLWEVNLQGSRNILWSCLKSTSVKKVVYTSSLSAIGIAPGEALSNEETPFNQYDALPYVLSKYLSQQEALGFAEHGLDLTVVNPAFPFGPGDVAPTPTGNIIINMINGATRFKFPGGFNLVDVRDVAAGHILAAEKGRAGERYILGNENLAGEDFCRLCARILGRSERLIGLPKLVVEGGALLGEWVSDNITHKRPPLVYGEVKYGEQYIYMDCSKARRELGFNPRNIQISLADSIRWFQSDEFRQYHQDSQPMMAAVNS